MMKFVHLSDLHIGKTVNGFSMLLEQRHAFNQVIEHIKTERPDAVVIAGDVYDRAVPGIDAVTMFDDFLTDLAAEDVTVLLVAGNHDSPERLSFASRLLSERKLHICGVFDGKLHKVTLTDSFGPVIFWLLPFVRPAHIRGKIENEEIESYTQAISAALETGNIDYSARNVVVSHQFYRLTGVDPIRSESEIDPIGGLDAVDASILLKFDYAALGHLHGPQNVAPNIRYAGSPVKYSFSECNHNKSITLVELGKKGELAVKFLPLNPIRDMREIKGTLEELLRGQIPSYVDREDYLKVILTDKDEIIDPIGKIRAVYPNIMALEFESPRMQAFVPGITAEAVESLNLYDLFSQFYLESSSCTMTREQCKIVEELLEGSADYEA